MLILVPKKDKLKMVLSEEQRKKIEEEEKYRAEIRDQSKEKKGIGCFGIAIILFGVGLFASIVLSSINPSKMIEEARQTSSNQPKVVNPFFDVPSLVGKDLDGIIAVLGAPIGEDPTTLQIQMGFTEWSKTFVKDGKELLVTYNISDGSVIDFFISTEDPSGLTKDKNNLLKMGNLNEKDSRYKVEFVKAIKYPSSFTGVKIIPLR